MYVYCCTYSLSFRTSIAKNAFLPNKKTTRSIRTPGPYDRSKGVIDAASKGYWNKKKTLTPRPWSTSFDLGVC